MKVLVVGASGFVGRRIVEALAGTPGFAPVAGVRRAEASFGAAGIEERRINAADPASARAALAGIDIVVNCVMAAPEVMVAATRALLAGAAEAGAKRFIHFSSIAVYGGATGRLGEDAPFAAEVDAYGGAKIAAERLVEAARHGPVETVILRPGLIHGPGSEAWTARIARLLVAGRLGDLGRHGDGRCNLIFIDDITRAALAAITLPEAANRSFNLAPAAPPTWNAYLRDFGRALGAVPVHRLPDWQLTLERKVLAIPLKAAELIAGRLPMAMPRLPDPITPGLARLFSQDVTYRTAAADLLLAGGETPYAASLAAGAEWFTQRVPG